MALPCLVSNSAAHPWVVQKFGGTSVGKFPDKVGSTFPVPSMASRDCHACGRGSVSRASYLWPRAMRDVTQYTLLTWNARIRSPGTSSGESQGWMGYRLTYSRQLSPPHPASH